MTKDTLWRAAAVIAICLFPLLNFLAVNADVLAPSPASTRYVFFIIVGLALLGLCLLAVAGRFGKAGAFMAWWVMGVLAFFHYGVVPDPTHAMLKSAGLTWLPNLSLLLLAAIAVWILRRYTRRPAFQKFVATFALALAALAGIRCAMAWAEISAAGITATAPAKIAAAPRRTHENIYYIILDGYAGNRGMRDFLHFDNRAFLRGMASAGFSDVGGADSNYFRTNEALGGIFNLDYLPARRNPELLFPRVRDHHAPLTDRLRGLGYDLWQTESLYFGCGGVMLACLNRQQGHLDAVYVTQSFLLDSLASRYTAFFLRKPDAAFATVANNQQHLMASGKPFFVFVHQLYPHPPYLLDAQCRPRLPDDAHWNSWDAEAIPEYLDVVRCLNTSVQAFVTRITRNDPDAIIVIQSDHGSAFGVPLNTDSRGWSRKALSERSSFLNLVRAPQACKPWLPPALGQVNTARFVLACTERRPPDYLPERSWLDTEERGGRSD